MQDALYCALVGQIPVFTTRHISLVGSKRATARICVAHLSRLRSASQSDRKEQVFVDARKNTVTLSRETTVRAGKRTPIKDKQRLERHHP